MNIATWQQKLSGLTHQESVVGVPRSNRKEPNHIKKCAETLILSPAEESIGRFCCRLNYTKKSESHPNTNVKLSTSQPSVSSKTCRKQYCCKLCGIEYCRRGNLVSHMRIHTGETPYCCDLCGKGFRRSDYLKLHIKIHKGEKRQRNKPFVCEQCGMKFCNSTSLQNHIWKHNGERPYACSLCEKTFYSKGILKRHKTDCHSLEKEFFCSLCGRGFARLHTLQKHTRIHTGEKPFSCSQCGKTFGYKYSLYMHCKHSGKCTQAKDDV